MSARISPAAAAALALAQSGVTSGELIHVEPGASCHDLDSGRYFSWRRGGVVRAWPDVADPASRTCWAFTLFSHWCAIQNVFVDPVRPS